MADTMIHVAITKMGIALGNEATRQATAYFAKSVTQLTELHGSMGRIMWVLDMMRKFLCQMDVRNRSDQVYESWLKRVRKVVFDIEDMVDQYLYLVGQEQDDIGWRFYLKKSFTKPKTLLSLSKLASKVKEAEGELARLSQFKEQWAPATNLGVGNNSSSSDVVKSSLEQASKSRYLEKEDLVGIDPNRQKLQEWLEDEELERTVIVVHGMGGLGKTTLASVVYKMECPKFECHAWVPVSQVYSRRGVVKKLITELFTDKNRVTGNIDTMDNNMTAIPETLNKFLEDKEHHLDAMDVTIREAHTLKKLLEEKKYLIVLDDVGDPEAYTDLFESLPNRKGSRILITTRRASVAHLASKSRILELEPLSEGDTWKLFCKRAFPDQEECPKELENLSKQILDRCKGLPLAIVFISSLLRFRDKTIEEWKWIYNQLSWELINNPKLDHLRNVLCLNFIYLPTYLKSCFLYCSLFPEDYILSRKMLVRLWMAEGFVEKRGHSTIEEVAESYLKELVDRNMLQVVERNSIGRMKSFQMHDIVRELAVDLCRRECFGVPYQEDDRGGGGGESLDEKYGRRLVVGRWRKDIDKSVWSARHLRSVIALHTCPKCMPSSTLVVPIIMGKVRYMSVLELNGLPIDKVPDAIGNLFNLRHLGLRDSEVKLLPDSVEKLHNLLTLDLARSHILELPRGITKLKKLRHLFAERRRNDVDGQDSHFRRFMGVCIKDIASLTDLQTLQALEVVDDESARQLGELRQMRSLRIWNVQGIYCENLCRSIVQMRSLSNLDINASDMNEVLWLDGLTPLPPNLEKLHLRGRLMDNDALWESPAPLEAAKRSQLYCLWLSWSQLREDPLPYLSGFSNLSELGLNRAYSGEQLTFLSGWFPKLKELHLIDLPNLKRLEIQQGTMASLEELVLMDLPGITEVPPGIDFLMPLRSLHFHLHMTPELSASVDAFFESHKLKRSSTAAAL